MTTETLEPGAAGAAPADAENTQPTTEPTQAAATEQPSPDEGPKSALDAAIAAQKRFRETAERRTADAEAAHADTSKAAQDEGDDAPASDDAEDLLGRIPNDEYAALPTKTRARIKEFRTRMAALDQRLKEFEPKAAGFAQLQDYVRQVGLSQEDFVQSLELAALVKSNPAAAYERMQPIIQQLQSHVGERLPDDLKQAVEEGSLSEDYAKQLAKERAERTRLSQTVESRAQQEAAERALAQEQEQKQASVDAIKALEASWNATDPDYKVKAQRIWERMNTIMQTEGRKPTPEYLTDVAKRAKKDVDDWLKSVVPGKREMRVMPDSNDAPLTAAAEPKSAFDAARRGLQKVRAAAP